MPTDQRRLSSKAPRKALRRVRIGALVVAVVFSAMLVAALALHWPRHQALHSITEARALSTAMDTLPSDRSSQAAAIEAQTQGYLTQLEARLVAELARERAASDRFWADLRMAALGPQGDAKRVDMADALRWLLQQADAALPHGVFIRIDMEEYAYKDLTIAVFRELVESEPELSRDLNGRLRLGIVTQAYLRDAARDLAALADWARARGVRVPVRLVKGAYVQYEKELARAAGHLPPVWNFKSSTDANYEALTHFLLTPIAVSSPGIGSVA